MARRVGPAARVLLIGRVTSGEARVRQRAREGPRLGAAHRPPLVLSLGRGCTPTSAAGKEGRKVGRKVGITWWEEVKGDW